MIAEPGLRAGRLRRFLLLGWLSLLCNIATAAQTVAVPAEQTVTLAAGLSGQLQPAPGLPAQGAVLLLHGWNGTLDEVGGLYRDLAQTLAQRGIASLRFNFTGEGARNGYRVTSTRSSRLREASTALAFLRERQPSVPLGLVGFSLGGLTAMELIGAQPQAVSSLVLWSAAQDMTGGDNATYDDAVRTALAGGEGIYRTYADITLTREFVASYVAVDASRHLARYPGALLTIRGELDYLARHDPKWLQLAPGSDKAFLLIGNADHIFNVLEQPPPNFGQRVITATANWFERTLADAGTPPP